MKQYCASLLSFLSSSKKTYLEIIGNTNQFTEEAESLLKEAIAESKEVFMKNK